MTDHQSLSLADGMRQTRVTYPQLWTLYVALGGSSSVAELQRHVESEHCPDAYEHNLIAQALNDIYVEDGRDHPVAYRHLHLPE